jgi:hypothetical protein
MDQRRSRLAGETELVCPGAPEDAPCCALLGAVKQQLRIQHAGVGGISYCV